LERQANFPKWGRLWILELISWERGQHSKLNCPTFLREELTRVVAEGQHSCHLVKTATALTTLHELSELSYLPIETNPVDRKNQILLTSHSPGEITSELLLVHQYQDWAHKE
jgi:hypothetical protein